MAQPHFLSKANECTYLFHCKVLQNLGETFQVSLVLEADSPLDGSYLDSSELQ